RGDPELALVDDECRGNRAGQFSGEVPVDDEQVWHRHRRYYDHQQREIGDHGLRSAAGIGAIERAGARKQLQDVHFGAPGILAAAHLVAADDGEVPAERSRLELLARSVPDEKVAAEGGGDEGVERLLHEGYSTCLVDWPPPPQVPDA